MQKLLTRHWFWLLTGLIVIFSFSVSWQAPPISKSTILTLAGLLIIGVPILYLICYRDHALRRKAIRAVLLFSLMSWVTLLIFPSKSHPDLDILMFAGALKWLIFIYLEMAIILLLWKTMFKQKKSVFEAFDVLAEEKKIPAWAAKAGKWEAALWIKLWSFFKRDVRKNQ